MCIFARQKQRMKGGGERNINKGEIRSKKNEIKMKKRHMNEGEEEEEKINKIDGRQQEKKVKIR